MMQINFSPAMIMVIKQHQDELIKEAAQVNLARQLELNRATKQNSASMLLAKIGKILVIFGGSLEQRFGSKIEVNTEFNRLISFDERFLDSY